MNIEYINPFIEASQSVLQSTAGMVAKLGKVFIRKTPYENGMPLVDVGLFGKIDGEGTICIPIPLAKKIVSQMMGGMEIAELDAMSVSALSELANMIMGNTATILYSRGIGIDITPPKMGFGDGVRLPRSDMQSLSVPLVIDDTDVMELSISMSA